ncbi:MAG TPA: MCE family protein [Terriglobales bacterium]|nr:MCE family protein [Terriglobales bacterium]
MRSNTIGLGVIAIVVAAVLGTVILLMPLRLHLHTVKITTHLRNGAGLKEGAPVRLAGVDIGKVASVRVWPGDKEGEVEVVMKLGTPYELPIPNDSVVSLSTEGVLGETYVNIDTSNASGAPIAIMVS